MSERGAGFGPFLLGLGLGAVLGFLFAPEPGEASRGKLSSKLRGLRDLAAEKAGELLDAAEDEEDEFVARRQPGSAEWLERFVDGSRGVGRHGKSFGPSE